MTHTNRNEWSLGDARVLAVAIFALFSLLGCGGGGDEGGGGGGNPGAVAPDPPRYLYTMNLVGSISAFRIESNGVLTRVDCNTGTPAVDDCSVGMSPYGITLDPSRRYVYVSDTGGAAGTPSITVLRVEASGALTPLQTAISQFMFGPSPREMAVDSNGRGLVLGNVRPVTVEYLFFRTQPDGTLIDFGNSNSYGVTETFAVTAHPTGGSIYMSMFNDVVLTTVIPAVGRPIDQTDNISNGEAGVHINDMVVHPSGRLLYIADSGTNTVRSWSLDDTTLRPEFQQDAKTTRSHPWNLAMNPNGQFLYVTESDFRAVKAFRTETNGLLTPLGLAGASNALHVAVDTSGQFAYTTNFQAAGEISAYRIGSDGLFTFVGSYPTGGQPTEIVTTFAIQ